MFQYVEIIGTTQSGAIGCILTDGIHYALTSYGPVVAPRNDNDLGAVYADVEESITLHALGCTAAEAYAAVAAINDLMDQAWRWQMGEDVEAVRLRLQAQGSMLQPIEAAIVGRAPGAGLNTVLPATWSADYGKYVVQDVTIQFTRHGQLLAPIETTAASSSAANPTVQTRTFATSIDILSPLNVQLASLPTTAGGDLSSGVLLVADTVQRIEITEAEGFATAGPYSTVADAANNARGGSVKRFTPAGAGAFASTDLLSLGTFDGTVQRMDVWAAVRNNSATRTYTIRAASAGFAQGSPVVGAFGPLVSVGFASQLPQIVFLGTLVSRNGHAYLRLDCMVDTVAGAGTLDIDYFVCHARDNDACSAIVNAAVADLSIFSASYDLLVQHRLLNEPQPRLILENSGGTAYLGYNGNAILNTQGDIVATAWLATGGLTAQNYWRYSNAAGTVVSLALTASRNRAYLIPE